MRQRTLSALTWRAGVAVAATVLAAGTGATTFHLVNDTTTDGTELERHDTTTTTTVDDTTTTTDGVDAGSLEDQGADKDAVTADESTAGDHPDHPDNFGATVSADARDGGVDGQEISEMAHERNDARKASAVDATADDDSDQPSGNADDHRQDGEHRPDQTED